MNFTYGEKEVECLKFRDKKLATAIEKIGQQISTVAQKTIWERLSVKLVKVDAENILSLNRAELQSFSLKGIGVWTAEMIMTFCMERPDVVSFGDLAIAGGAISELTDPASARKKS